MNFVIAVLIGGALEIMSHMIHSKYGYNGMTGWIAAMPVAVTAILLI